MKMLRQRIAPRAQLQSLLELYQGEPLSKSELAQVVTALKESGVEKAFSRLIDDAVRHALDQLEL